MTTELQLKPYDMEITHEGINPFIGLNLNNVNMFRDYLTNYLISYLRSTDIENDKDAEIVWLSSTYFIKEMMGLYTSLYFANQVSSES